MDVLLQWLQDNTTLLIGITVVLLVLLALQRLFRAIRLRRPAKALHPKLQAYAGRSAADIEEEGRMASRVIATSTTGAVAGYEIVQQIEAVFVEGYRSPQEASVALKAEAGRRGANALINLSQQRTAAGRCSAHGDAVRVQPKLTGNAARPPTGQ